MTMSLFLFVVVVVISHEIVEVGHGIVEDRPFALAFRGIVLAGSRPLFECNAGILYPAVRPFRFGQFEVIGPVAHHVELVDEPVAVVVQQLPERHIRHRGRPLFGVVAHIHEGELAQSVPLLVGREERHHAVIVVAERMVDELVEVEKRHIVRDLVFAHEMVVLVAEHPESENHCGHSVSFNWKLI